MPQEKVNLAQKFARFSEHWSPKLIENLDDYDVKLAKFQGDFVWRRHENEDELFFVVRGQFRMDFRERQVEMNEGEMIVVPKGVEHKPYATEECEVLVIVRGGVVNTGDAVPSAVTQRRLERI